MRNQSIQRSMGLQSVDLNTRFLLLHPADAALAAGVITAIIQSHRAVSLVDEAARFD